jgi:hypothetical protein
LLACLFVFGLLFSRAGVGLSSPVAGTNATFFIEAKDTYGNNVKNTQNFAIQIKRLVDNQRMKATINVIK